VHAIELARELEIPTVVVPQMPGLFSAFGMLVADQTYDLQLPVLKNLDDIAAGDLAERFRQLDAQAASLFREAGIAPGDVALRRRADCRYLGQAESLTIDVPEGPVTGETAAALARAFEGEHRRHWNFTQPDRPISLVNLRLQAVVETPGRKLAGAGERARSAPKPYRQRSITIAGSPTRLPAYRRQDLRFGHELAGPAVIEEPSSSLVFPEGWRAAVDGEQNLIVKQVG
jgi:N-methylhydantoinase A